MGIRNGSFVDFLLIALILGNLLLLGSSRLMSYIRICAAQGLLVSALTFILHRGEVSARIVVLVVGSAVLKAGLFPWLLIRAVRVAYIKKEIEPIVGYSASLIFGVLILALSLWLSARLPIHGKAAASFVPTAAFFTIFTGCFLIVSRTKAITQVISYLVLENGIYLFGLPFVGEAALLIELGVFLDLTVGVAVMGIIIYHISREFDSLDVKHLSTLKDWGS
ncbi:MAG: hydrogenase [Deltaproteobacteria bacterium]|nr:hydrogenase [Deltaproteobacteria bacterium]